MHNPTSDDNNESIPFDIGKKRGYQNCLKRYSSENQNEFDRMDWKKKETGLTLKYWHRNAFQAVDYYNLILLYGSQYSVPIT